MQKGACLLLLLCLIAATNGACAVGYWTCNYIFCCECNKKCVNCWGGEGPDHCIDGCSSGYMLNDLPNCEKCVSPCSECEGTTSTCTACQTGYLFQPNNITKPCASVEEYMKTQ